MPDERLPKKILYGELQVGKRFLGGQKRRYKDTLKASLKDFNIPTESWEHIAQDQIPFSGKIIQYVACWNFTKSAERYRTSRLDDHKETPDEHSQTKRFLAWHHAMIFLVFVLLLFFF